MKKLKTKFIWFVVITISIIVILLLISNSLKIDIGNILFGIASIGFVYVLYQYLEHKKIPKKRVNISLKSKLISPIVKLNRYKFHIIIEHEITDKDEVTKIKADELEIKFRKKDHPDLYKWCFEFATDKMTEHIRSAKIQYPDAKVTYSPVPEISALKEVNE
tara:strand:- start:6 stop:491 length:486 start_codon:yes stop_codon:yes gene_type:complete